MRNNGAENIKHRRNQSAIEGRPVAAYVGPNAGAAAHPLIPLKTSSIRDPILLELEDEVVVGDVEAFVVAAGAHGGAQVGEHDAAAVELTAVLA